MSTSMSDDIARARPTAKTRATRVASPNEEAQVGHPELVMTAPAEKVCRLAESRRRCSALESSARPRRDSRESSPRQPRASSFGAKDISGARSPRAPSLPPARLATERRAHAAHRPARRARARAVRAPRRGPASGRSRGRRSGVGRRRRASRADLSTNENDDHGGRRRVGVRPVHRPQRGLLADVRDVRRASSRRLSRRAPAPRPVSYTHLTLPTILLV